MHEDVARFDRTEGKGYFNYLWQCLRCGTFHSDEARADACCDKVLCTRCEKQPRATGNIYCMECLHIRAAERLQEKLDAAELADDDGPVTEDGERWWDDVEAYIEWCVDQEVAPDQHVFAGKKNFLRMNARDIIDAAVGDVYDGIDDADDNPALVGEEDLIKAIDKFVADNQHVYVWEIDYTRKVMVYDDPEELQDYQE